MRNRIIITSKRDFKELKTAIRTEESSLNKSQDILSKLSSHKRSVEERKRKLQKWVCRSVLCHWYLQRKLGLFWHPYYFFFLILLFNYFLLRLSYRLLWLRRVFLSLFHYFQHGGLRIPLKDDSQLFEVLYDRFSCWVANLKFFRGSIYRVIFQGHHLN